MKILVTFALENEFAPWRRLREFRGAAWSGERVEVSNIDGAEVGALLTGVGPQHAAERARKMISGERSIGHCISSGLSGALRAEYTLNQVVVARTVCRDISCWDSSADEIECDVSLVSAAKECGATLVERICTSDRVAASEQEKRRLAAKAAAVEMESFEVVKAAKRFGVGSVAIRAISDTASEALPLDMNRIIARDGHVSYAKVIGQLALQPHALPRLIRFGEQSKRAAESLVKFLDRYIGALVRQEAAISSRNAIGAPIGHLG